jgi:hypothetical protein
MSVGNDRRATHRRAPPRLVIKRGANFIRLIF